MPVILQNEIKGERASNIIQHSSKSRKSGEETDIATFSLLLFTMLSHNGTTTPEIFRFLCCSFICYQQIKYKLYSRMWQEDAIFLAKVKQLPDCLLEVGARTMTCIVVIPEKSQIGLLHSDRVLLFSSIFPALISLRSFTVLGPFSLSVEKEQ